jgi:hypothetical protein
VSAIDISLTDSRVNNLLDCADDLTRRIAIHEDDVAAGGQAGQPPHLLDPIFVPSGGLLFSAKM